MKEKQKVQLEYQARQQQTDDMRRMRNFSQLSSTAEIELLLLNNPAEILAHLFPFPPTWTPSM